MLRSVAGASLLAALMIGAVASALLRPVEPLLDYPMSVQREWWTRAAYPLFETGGPTPPVYVTGLLVRDPHELLRYPEIQLPISTDRFLPNVLDARVTMEGTSCVYRTTQATHRPYSTTIRLLADPSCTAVSGKASRNLTLIVTTKSRQRLALWGFSQGTRAESLAPSTIEVMGLGEDPPPYPILHGRYVTHEGPDGLRRVDLLAYLWDVAPSRVWAAVAIAAMGLFAGVVALSKAAWRLPAGHGPRLLIASGAFAIAGSLALSHAMLLPPLRAPDEPNHLLSYARLTGQTGLFEDVETLARRTHFARITFDDSARFRPADIGNSWPIPWRDHVSPADQAARGGLTVALWKNIAGIVGETSATRAVLILRLVNAFVFALAVAGAAAALAAARVVPAPHLAALVFVLVPTLPFFAIGVSNHALIVSAYVLLAGALGAHLLGGGRSAIVGLALGSACAVLLVGGISALPTLVIAGALLGLRVVAGSPGDAGESTSRFWLAFGLSAAILAAIAGPANEVDLFRKAGPYRGALVSAVRWAPVVFLLVALAGASAERWLQARVRRWVARPAVATTMRAALLAWAIAVVVLAVGSAAVPYPMSRPMEEQPDWPTTWDYARELLSVALTSGRITGPDWHMGGSFWAGFGWLDTYPGAWVANTLTTLSVLMFAGLLVSRARARDSVRAIWLIALFGAALAAIAVYAAGGVAARTNVHGRYLVGVYLSGLMVAWAGLAWDGPGWRLWRFRAQIVLTFAVALHAYCLWFILARHF
jgi:hypothetical protein